MIKSRHRFSRFFPSLFLLTDLTCLNLSFLTSHYEVFGSSEITEGLGSLLLGLNFIWCVIFISLRLYEMGRDNRLINDLNKALLGVIISLALVFTIYFFREFYFISRKQIFYHFLYFSVAVTSWRLVWDFFIQYWRKRGFNIRNFVVFGAGPISEELIDHFNSNPGIGYRFHGKYDNANKDIIEKLRSLERPDQVDVIFCNIQALAENEIKTLIDFAENNLVKIKMLSPFIRIGGSEISITKYGDIPIIDVNYVPLDHLVNKVAKRTFDIIFSSLVIVLVLSWLFPLIAILIKLDSKGPVLFRQLRDGKNHKKFVVLKFRTMVTYNDSEFKQATKDDSRITRIGSILRRTSLDELPQFINVFLGEMSVVGPRPHPVKLNEQYQPVIDRFVQRHAVKPGITGLAQARGFRGETTHINDMVSRVKLDRFYIKNWSMILDFKIILLTITSILKGSEKAF